MSRCVGFRFLPVAALLAAVLAISAPASAQTWQQRGFVEASGWGFPMAAANDDTRFIGEVLAREEVFAKPTPWLQIAAGADFRSNSHEQVENDWRVDFSDRTTRRPRLSLRRLTATVRKGPVSVDAGKQFIRWGRTDILNPTDHFAPRDFLSVVDTEFLPVTGVRTAVTAGDETIEGVWLPRMTPSRIPLLDQRWTVVPTEASGLALVDGGATVPSGSQYGIRWNHQGRGFEASASYFDGFNHLPNLDVALAGATATGAPLVIVHRSYPPVRSVGFDAALPTRWVTIKAEAASYRSPSPVTDEYVLYVIQLERQTGEWVLAGGYAGELVTNRRSPLTFSPDRGLARSIVARAAYTLDVNRTAAFETAIRQSGNGAYFKAEFSQAFGEHWRLTADAVAITGETGDFLGQYRRNSHAGLRLRYSF